MVGVKILFGKRKQVVKRILIVEDEPLTAFDNENMLGDAGYEIVATVDDFDEAIAIIAREEVHLILSDVRLRSTQTGIDLAHRAKERGVPTLFATGHAHPDCGVAVGASASPIRNANCARRSKSSTAISRAKRSRRRGASNCSAAPAKRNRRAVHPGARQSVKPD